MISFQVTCARFSNSNAPVYNNYYRGNINISLKQLQIQISKQTIITARFNSLYMQIITLMLKEYEFIHTFNAKKG